MLTGPPPKFHGTWDILSAPSAMTFRNNIGPDAVAAATLAPSAFEPGLAPFKLLAAAAAVGSGRAGSGQYILDASGDD